MEHGKSTHIYAMYVLIGLLAIALAFTAFHVSSRTQMPEDWECSRAVCGKYTDPVQWVATNCAPAAGTEDRTCTVNIEGANTSIPLSLINLTYVAQQCEAVTCTQEVHVRPTNHTVPAAVVR